MIVVIFEVELLAKKADRSFELAKTLKKYLSKIDGFISIERFQRLTNEYNFFPSPIGATKK